MPLSMERSSVSTLGPPVCDHAHDRIAASPAGPGIVTGPMISLAASMTPLAAIDPWAEIQDGLARAAERDWRAAGDLGALRAAQAGDRRANRRAP